MAEGTHWPRGTDPTSAFHFMSSLSPTGVGVMLQEGCRKDPGRCCVQVLHHTCSVEYPVVIGCKGHMCDVSLFEPHICVFVLFQEMVSVTSYPGVWVCGLIYYIFY